MRYIEGRFDQFESLDKNITGMEKYEIIEEYRSRQMEMASAGLGQIKEYFTNKGEVDQQLPYKTETDQIPEGKSKKAGWGILIFVILLFIAVIVAAAMGNVVIALGIFFGGFIVLALYAAITGNARSSSYYEGQTSTGTRKTALWLAAFGVAVVVPLFFIPKFGTKGSMILMGASLFGMVAVYMIVGLIDFLTLKVRKYTEKVSANCVGYVRTVKSSRSNSSHGGSVQYYLTTSPLFEYYYEGQMYRGLYDRPLDDRNGDVELGSTTILIDPKHPEDIYHGSVVAPLKGVGIGILCAVIAAFLFYNFFTTDYAEQAKKEISIFKIMSVMKDPESFDPEDFGLGDLSDIPSELTDELIEEHYGTDTWYVEEAKVDYVSGDNEGNYTVHLLDEAFPVLHQHYDAGPKELIFYRVEESEENGQTKINKVPFLWLNADEYTYVGDHGAYEK